MDRLWKSGIMAGLAGAVITLLNLIVLGSWFKVLTEQTAVFLLLLLLANLLAFLVAGFAAGILVSPYARNEMDALKTGMIAGSIVACFPALMIVVLIMAGFFKFETSILAWAALLAFLVFASILLSQVALAGLISMVYTNYARKKDSAVPAEEGGLEDLRALYEDLWKDARTLATDMGRSIWLYLFSGIFTLVYGIVILAYAVASWQHILAGSRELADYAAAVGETIGGVIQVIVGPLLIRWYLKLKSRYARLASMGKGDRR